MSRFLEGKAVSVNLRKCQDSHKHGQMKKGRVRRNLYLYDMRSAVQKVADEYHVSLSEACVMLITWGLEAYGSAGTTTRSNQDQHTLHRRQRNGEDRSDGKPRHCRL